MREISPFQAVQLQTYFLFVLRLSLVCWQPMVRSLYDISIIALVDFSVVAQFIAVLILLWFSYGSAAGWSRLSDQQTEN
jgi:hypothetical protein